MRKTTEYLNPKRKLVDETVEWLFAGDRVRETPEGAHSLGHVMVVVPTAQSGRNLRLGLARKAAQLGWGGLIPPRIAMADQLLAPSGVRVATEAEELAAMGEVLAGCEIGQFPSLFPKPPAARTVDWALSMAGVFLEVEKILGENALAIGDVAPQSDAERWRDLARIEALFFASLRGKGATPRALARKLAVQAGCRETGIEEIVLPGAVDAKGAFIAYLEASSQLVRILIHACESDAAKFDEWGRPTGVFAAAIAPELIEEAPDAVIEADDIAKYFKAVKAGEALPALAVCDSEMFPELEGAFQNHFSGDELVLRNPSRCALAISPLGRLLGAILELSAKGDYDTFSAFVRTGDVARWAANSRHEPAAAIARYIGALDAVQKAHLPRTLDEALDGAKKQAARARSEEERQAFEALAAIALAVKEESASPFGFLAKIFSSLRLDEKNPSDRELIAAAQAVRELREECASEIVPERFRRRLFAKMVESATYMLEPVAQNVLAATGWLEVPWCPDDELVIAGFNEGCVPENVVGHAFVPDCLRESLGLAGNAAREARDSFIFAEAVACRAPGAVRVHLHQIAADRNVAKPSRILFNGISDDDLPALARRLYSVVRGAEGSPPKELPPGWRLKLPFPPAGKVYRERISPTRIDAYLKCPFTFFLDETFGERSDDRALELDAAAFGNLCHGALEAFAKRGPKDSGDAAQIADFLAAEVKRLLADFGENLPAVVELQGDAAIERLRAFSVHQAARRRAGWRIAESELRLECRIGSIPTVIAGRIDRIDRHEETGELAIIDYKTWRRADAGRYDSVQLPLYRAMVMASGRYEEAAAHAAKAFYCILAERAEDTRFDEGHAFHEGLQRDADLRVAGALEGIARGIFYPPRATGADADWRAAYDPLIWESPEEGLAPEWIADQLARKEAVA